MSGFFRRLRRPKEEPEPEEESALAPDGADQLPEESSVEPEGPAAPEPGPDAPVAPDPPPAPSVPDVGPEVPPIPPSSPVPAPEPSRPSPVPPPPPLPEADRIAARGSLTPRRTSTQCFVCGTELDGPWCPTCRIAWND
jgi:hypothetical protein